MIGPSLFERCRDEVSLADFAGKLTTLVKRGAELRGICPMCNSGAKKGSLQFVVYPAGRRWHCFADCGRGGDVVDLYREVHPCEPLEAARVLLGGAVNLPATSRPKPNPKPAAGPSTADLVAAEILAEAVPAVGSPVETYLRSRGIIEPVIAAAAPNLRFHPRAKHHWDERARVWFRAPAMIMVAATQSGPTGGVHATYLNAGGLGRDTALGKLMWGPHKDAQDRPGGAWLIGPEGEGDLACGEGCETTLSGVSLAVLAARPMMRAVAALSLDRLQGRLLRDADRRIDPYDPQGDPAHPAFTWPTPAASPWAEVVTLIDRDMSPVKMRGRTGKGRTCDFIMDTEARARICARLSVRAWRAAGAPKVRAIAPPFGADFNVALRRVRGLA